LQPTQSALSDINSDLVDLYVEAQRRPFRLYASVRAWPEWRRFYYVMRAADPRTLTRPERAARLLYLNRFSFNGVYRTNRDGQFNVPRGRDTGAFPDWDSFSASAKVLRASRIVGVDFEEALDRAQRNDFVYLDPPYARRKKTEFGQY